MVTKPYVLNEFTESGQVYVQWDELNQGDDGEPLECKGMELVSYQVWGTRGGATLDVSQSFEWIPTHWRPMFQPAVPSGGNTSVFAPTAMRPLILNGDGTTNISLAVVLRRFPIRIGA